MAKFETLTHNGVVFPEEYKPYGYKVNGVQLPALAEEMLYNYAGKIETDYVKDSGFVENFYSCLKPELPANLKTLKFPEDFNTVLRTMFNDIQFRKEEKKAYNKEHKIDIKKEKEALKEKYGWAILNGKKTQLGGYLIEPPGIMMARGKSPLRGMWKYRVKPEDVVINYVGEGKAPEPPKGHKWLRVEANTNAFQIAWYKINVGNIFESPKKIMFAASTSVKTDKDKIKFDKAQKLAKNWDKIELHINKGLKSKNPKTQQAALVSWLILTTGIRVGGDPIKEGLDNGTVGASTLRNKNIKLEAVNE